ncbi:hypothetical protein LTR28_007478, partial [Elasticomyces elasticus]
RRERRRRVHHSTDSNGELLPLPAPTYDRDSAPPSPTKPRRKRTQRPTRPPESDSSKTTSNALSAGTLAKLDALNNELGWDEYENVYHRVREARTDGIVEAGEDRERRRREKERRRRDRDEYHQHRKKRRVVSGPQLERGREDSYRDKKYARHAYEHASVIIVGVFLLILAIAIPVGIVVSKKNSGTGPSSSGGATTSSATKPANSNLNDISESDIPASARGTVLDPFTWYDTTDFNVTYTAETVGGLSIMGLNSTWDDSAQANLKVPALKDAWQYGTMPIRGVNLGGWLSLEPFITPSFFKGYSTRDNVIDEWTLSSKLGPTKAKSTIEQHYSYFVSERTFAEIQAAGLDHVRIPFSYWAITTYSGDPYVPLTSWRYLLRGIEWARKHGLRVKLDLHGAPGSQNGWNHSGRQGPIDWLNGTNGALNGQRTLDLHNQLSTFFAQPRYRNLVTMYGLVNEPRMVVLDTNTVHEWTTSAINIIRKNNITAVIVFGDGFMGLDKWRGELQ